MWFINSEEATTKTSYILKKTMKSSLFLILFLKVAWCNVLSPVAKLQPSAEWGKPVENNVDLSNDMWESNEGELKWEHGRVRREAVTDEEVNTIETYVVVDYIAYQKYLLVTNNNSTKALEDLHFYITHVMQTVDQLFAHMADTKYTFRVSVLGIDIHTSSTQSPFTKSEKEFDFFGTFDKVKFWAKKKERNFPKNDLLVVFTGEFSDTLSGVAMMDSVCKGGMVFVTMAGLTIDAFVTAHEIAHAMGVRHDEEDSGCLKSDLLMNPWVGNMRYESVGSNVWSKCSVNAMNKYVLELEGSGINCLVQTSERKVQEDLQLPGTRWSAQDQCTTRLGPKSFLCVAFSEDICHKLFCYHETLMGCVFKPMTRAYDGTPCGNHKWCMDGKCVENDSAPAGEDHCRYGNAKEGFRLGNDVWACNKTLLVEEILTTSNERTNKKLLQDLKEVSVDMCVHEKFKKNCCEKCKNAI